MSASSCDFSSEAVALLPHVNSVLNAADCTRIKLRHGELAFICGAVIGSAGIKRTVLRLTRGSHAFK